MSFNWLLIWTVTISCSLVLISLLRRRVKVLWPYVPPAVVLGELLYCHRIDAESAGYYAGGLWFVLILLPGILIQASQTAVASKKFRRAKFLSFCGWLLHPWGGTKDQRYLVQAISLLQSGEQAAAMDLLQKLRMRPSGAGRSAFLLLTRLQGDWSGFLHIILNSTNRGALLADPHVANTYLEALGETGQYQQLVTEYQRLSTLRRSPFHGQTVNIARLKVAAFLGRTDLVGQLFDGPLGYFENAPEKFWMATAMQAAGRIDAANRIFSELAVHPDRQLASMAQRRLVLPVPVVPEFIKEESSPVLVEMEANLGHENRFALLNSIATVRPIATCSLLAILVLIFLAEMFNGEFGRIVWESTSLSLWQRLNLLLKNTTNNENLISMGALVIPTSLYPDPNWRVFRAAFLHFGLLHLSMNMAGLWVFGQRLEEAWGAFLTATAYLFCAVFSIYLMTLLPLGATLDEPYVLIGASGGVMGLIGCLLGYLAWGQLLKRNRKVGREFNVLFAIVMVQMIFDYNTPEVSSECHLLGLTIGVVIGFSVGLGKSMFRTKSR